MKMTPGCLHYRLIIEGEYLVEDPGSPEKLQTILDEIPDRDLFNHDPGPNGVIVKREVLRFDPEGL